MAKETITRLRDDLDGSDANATIQFSWDGVAYEIDLSTENADAFKAELERYTGAARRVSRTPRRSPARRPTGQLRVDLNAVREWATANGHTVAARGRIAAAIVDAFHAAQGTVADVGASAKSSAPATAEKIAAAKTVAKKAVKEKVAASKLDPNEVRAWASANGHKVADRGRIASAVVEAFQAVQNAVNDEATPQRAPATPAKKVPPRKAATARAPRKKAAAKRAATGG